jgi:hypothetical protein
MKEPAMGGIHGNRLAASKAHRDFVKEVRRAVQKAGLQIPQGGLSPALVGAKPVALPVSPVFEAAFGYRGNLRFVQFGYTAASLQFGYSDGGDDFPSDETLWSWFLRHPVVSPHLPETQYPTLYGRFPTATGRPPIEEIMRGGAGVPTCHCLVLDRRDRQAYASERDQAMMLFALMEPNESDDHKVFVDGLLMSPGCENYKLPPAPELLMEFRRFLDSQVPVRRGTSLLIGEHQPG